MNYKEIISDFDALKQVIVDFKNQMTIDDFYFYQRSPKFNEPLKQLCEKHFHTSWYSLPGKLETLFSKASKEKNAKQKKSIHTLSVYFFAIELTYQKKYEIEIEDDPNEEPDWKGRVFGIERKVWKGKYEVHKKHHQDQECFSKTIEIEKPEKQNLLPTNWRKIIAFFIDSQWSNFSGIFHNDSHIECTDLEGIPSKPLITADYTSFLALKNALRSDLQITTHENEVLIVVSSGIVAKIALRNTGKYVSELIQSENQIYSMTRFSWDEEKDYEYADKTLLHISGYAHSTVNIHTPEGYYFVGEQHVVQIEFVAAPILLGNTMIPWMSGADHSSVALLDDEEEERKRREEDDY